MCVFFILSKMGISLIAKNRKFFNTQDIWKNLNYEKKEEACLQLAQVELLRLTGKIDDTLTFYIANDYSEGGGFYDRKLNRITADRQYVYDRDYVIGLILYECFHYYEYYLLEGRGLDKRKLTTDESIEKYREEFDNYVDIDKDYEKYYAQQVEVDARSHQEKYLDMYLEYIDGKI